MRILGLARKTGQLLILALLMAVTAQGATVTDSGAATVSTSQAESYASSSFTPAAGDLLVVFVSASATTATGSLTDSQGLGWTKTTNASFSGAPDRLYVFVANTLAAASSMTVTFDCTGDQATGANIAIARVSGMTRTGTSGAIKQKRQVSGQSASTTPEAIFAASCQTGNPTLGVVGNRANPAGLTAPTNWTEQVDTGYNTPSSGLEYVSQNSGFTGTTITWGSTSSTVYGVQIIELDTSAAPTPSNTLAELCQKIDCGTLFSALLIPKIEQVVPFPLSNITSDGWAAIKGSGFGNEEGELFLVWNVILGPMEKLDIPSERNKDFWTPTSVFGRIPPITGKKDQPVWLLIKTKAGKNSNLFEVNFRAERELKQLQSSDVEVSCSYEADEDKCNSDYNNDDVPFCQDPFVSSGQDGDTIVGYHWTCVGDSDGTDSYSASLKNGWLFENAAFTNVSGGNSAAVTGFQSGTASMNVKVSWSNENVPYVLYRMNISIEGPKGVPHK
jgi:hypothetical protein